jgi:hypothetical protein
MARDCLRVEKLRVFGEYLCGVEPPMLAYSAETKKYYSVAPSDGYENDEPRGDDQDEAEISEVWLSLSIIKTLILARCLVRPRNRTLDFYMCEIQIQNFSCANFTLLQVNSFTRVIVCA